VVLVDFIGSSYYYSNDGENIQNPPAFLLTRHFPGAMMMLIKYSQNVDEDAALMTRSRERVQKLRARGGKWCNGNHL
jgi:hypothetical protein